MRRDNRYTASRDSVEPLCFPNPLRIALDRPNLDRAVFFFPQVYNLLQHIKTAVRFTGFCCIIKTTEIMLRCSALLISKVSSLFTSLNFVQGLPRLLGNYLHKTSVPCPLCRKWVLFQLS